MTLEDVPLLGFAAGLTAASFTLGYGCFSPGHIDGFRWISSVRQPIAQHNKDDRP